jgi:hypothetical protein
MMTYDEVVNLLAFCAVFDQRKADDTDVQAWLMIATDHRWVASAALRVARDHYGSGPDRPRLTPAMISERIRGLRNQAVESFELPKIPDGMLAVDYLAWEREQRAGHVTAQLDRWAATGVEPDRAQPVELGARSLPELIAKAPDHVRAELEAAARKINRR